MATGKSTLGKLVAERTGAPFVDLDQRIEQRAGATVVELFERNGEARFRALERDELEKVLDEARGASAPPVVALGGGALLRRDVRLRALDEAVVITLAAMPQTILARAATTGGRPLLANGYSEERVLELIEQRAQAYAEAHATVFSDQVAPAELAERLCAIWSRDPIAVAAGDRSYAVEVGASLAAERLPELAGRASRLLLVSDENVMRHHAALADALDRARPGLARVVLPPGEQHKNTGSLERIWQAALDASVDRQSVLIAIGGGVVSDVAGFAAASWMRGIRWIAVPTTLLAMVDASVGGKTAVDFGPAKNAVGAFWQPSAVVCDVSLLATEPARGYCSALAEIVKTAIIGDAELLDVLEDERAAIVARETSALSKIVRRSIRVKARIVGLDERESGLRAVLNLGHTVGHALEAPGGYTRLTHGEAVSLGLVAALELGRALGRTPAALAERARRLLAAYGLPVDVARQPLAEAAALIGHDKKRAGSVLRFVVAREAGQVEAVELGLEELRARVMSLAAS